MQGSSNHEIVKKAGLSFSSGEVAIIAIEVMSENRENYRDTIELTSSEKTAERYLALAHRIYKNRTLGAFPTQKVGYGFIIRYRILSFLVKQWSRLGRISSKMRRALSI